MANAKVELMDPADAGLIVELYNQIFSPGQDEDFFRRRFRARHNVTTMVAFLDDRPAGFLVGFELMPTTYFCWLCGVLPDFRRLAIATQMMKALAAWVGENDYSIIRFECRNQHRPMLHVAISEGYDLVGIRYDTATGNNVVIFEKELPDQSDAAAG